VWWIGSWGGDGQPEPDTLAAPIVDIAATSTGKGWTMVDTAGHVDPFGDASFHGDAHPIAPIVSIAITATNEGYWITTADGTILPFGDASPDRSTPARSRSFPPGTAGQPSSDGVVRAGPGHRRPFGPPGRCAHIAGIGPARRRTATVA